MNIDYRSLSATIDNSLPQENKNTSVERQEFESLSLRQLTQVEKVLQLGPESSVGEVLEWLIRIAC